MAHGEVFGFNIHSVYCIILVQYKKCVVVVVVVIVVVVIVISICWYLLTANGSVRGLTSSSNQLAAHSDVTSSAECVSVCDWTPSHVAAWLQRISMQRYVEQFTAQHVNGQTLLQLDSTKMKVLCDD